MLQITFTELAALLTFCDEAAEELKVEELFVDEFAVELMDELFAVELATELLTEELLATDEVGALEDRATDDEAGALEETGALDERGAEEEAGALEERGADDDAGALEERAEEERAEEEAQGQVSEKETLKSSMPLMGSTTTLIVCDPAVTVCGPQFQGLSQYCVNLVCQVSGETVK